jgi:hypothetical protein
MRGRMSDLQDFLHRQRRIVRPYIGYMYFTSEKDKWSGYVTLYGKKYNIRAEQDIDTESLKPTIIVYFTDPAWETHISRFVMTWRSKKTWGGTVHIPLELAGENEQDVNLSFHYNWPPTPQLKGRKPFAWRITPRV